MTLISVPEFVSLIGHKTSFQKNGCWIWNGHAVGNQHDPQGTKGVTDGRSLRRYAWIALHQKKTRKTGAMRGEPLPDEQLLMALHWRDTGEMNTTQIAARLGRTRGSLIGALNRVDHAIEEFDKYGNQNGSMGPLWWKR